MEQQDRFKHQIEQLGRVLGRLLADLFATKNESQANESIVLGSQTLKGLIDLHIEEVISTPESDLLDILVNDKKFTNENLSQLADLLIVISNKYRKKDWKIYAEKAILILEYLEKSDIIFSFDRKNKISQLKQKYLNHN